MTEILNLQSLIRNGIGDAAMDSGHGEVVKVFDGNPFSFSLSIDSLAVINIKGEFEVRISLLENPERPFDFDVDSSIFSNLVSQPQP